MITWGGSPLELGFNYKTRFNDAWDGKPLRERYGYTTVFPRADTEHVSVRLRPRDQHDDIAAQCRPRPPRLGVPDRGRPATPLAFAGPDVHNCSIMNMRSRIAS